MKNEKLTQDEYDALAEVARGIKGKPSACVGRNTKRLAGLKLFSVAKTGHVSLTPEGQQTLLLRRCILGMRALAADPATVLDADVALFLGKKSHIQPRADGAGHEFTEKGRASLADIDLLGF